MAGMIVNEGGGLAVRIPYNPRLLPILRALPGARWDSGIKMWRISSDPTDIPLILEAAKEHGWTMSVEADSVIRHILDQVDTSPARADDRLYPFQRAGVNWLAPRDRALLSDQMGLGKSAQSLVALPATAPVVIIAPASVKGSWKREIETWRPEYRTEILKGRNSFRWPANGEIVVVNYDILPVKPPDGAPTDLVLIVDEVHYCKNRKTKRAKAVRGLVSAARAAWGLTGTPMLNRPLELWSVLETLEIADKAFGHFGRFCRAFNGRKGRWAYEWGSPEPEVPGMLRRVSLRRSRKEVLPDLPAKTHRSLPVNNLPAGLRNRLDEALEQWKAEKQITGDELPQDLPEFDTMSELRADVAAAKIPVLLKLVEDHEEQDEPLVVFSAHRAPIDALATREGWGVITGDESAENRTQTVEKFQAGRLRGIALTIGAGREGITLTHAHQMIFVDLAWTPALNSQAEDRICRIGQNRGCQYTVLTAEHPLDERVNEILTKKAGLLAASTDAATRGAIQDPAEMLDEIQKKNPPTLKAKQPNVLNLLTRIPDGRYATVGANGEADFWTINSGKEGGRWEGWRFLRQKRGPLVERFATIHPDGSMRNSAALAILVKIAEDPREACIRYGQKIGKCGICGSDLTNDESRRKGIGPICEAKCFSLM